MRSGLPGAAWVVVGCASLLAVLAGVVWFLSGRVLSEADNWASVGGLVLSLLVGVPGLVVSIAALRLAVRQDRQTSVLEGLAAALEAEYRRESGVRDLNDLLPVSWSAVGPADLAARAAPAGRVDGVVDEYLALPGRRLVVLGGPGAGKTVLAVELARGLVKAREPGDPVPVILPVASWDPAERLDSWMARRIAETYSDDRTAALVATRKVLPVLDGLDEMAEPSRTAAVRAINRWLPRDEPVVLTCRTDAYRELLEQETFEPLAHASVVELQPLRGEDVLAYLRDATPQRLRDKWDAVRLVAGTPQAEALSTPLMASLARAAYSRGPGDLRALLALGTQEAVEEHLLERFVPSVYPDNGKALRWLRTLAWLSERRGTQSLNWWELPFAVSRTAFGAVVVVLFALVGVLNGLLVSHPIEPGHAVGIGVVVAFGVVVAGRQSSPPTRTSLRLPTTPDEVRAALRALTAGLAAGVTAGFGFALVYAYLALLSGPKISMEVTLALGSAITITIVLPLCLVMLMTAPADIARAATPHATLRADRRRTLLVVAAAVFSAGPLVWFRVAPWIGAFVGPALGLTLFVTSAWGSLAVLRVAVLAKWPSRLPVRVVSFLDDAHRRGVLRQVGATYRFRHLRLRQHLARTHPYRDAPVGGRHPAAMRLLYAVVLVGAVAVAGYLYFVAFEELSEEYLLGVVFLWVFPLVLGFHGLVGEALVARAAPGQGVADAARDLVSAKGRWVLPGVYPFLLVRSRAPLPAVLVTTALSAVPVMWFLTAVFPGL
ncbi:NACHT domain-containing protein [Actinosynnema sp. NPDC053489]|uniref:NACHT domain-containing protein n=1 Tax=Actinosynnema sp. NPDC053489 TaxID=3363916 RepID=UPI0037C87D10